MAYSFIPTDIFADGQRDKGCFWRIASWNDEVKTFASEFAAAAKQNGFGCSEHLRKPEASDTTQCLTVIGSMKINNKANISLFLTQYLSCTVAQADRFAQAIFDIQMGLVKNNAGESILKNITVKFMFWLKNYCMSAINGGKSNPKALFCGQLTNHEMLFLSVIADTGYDVLVIEKNGDDQYRSIDPENRYSVLLTPDAAGNVPSDLTAESLLPAPKKIDLTHPSRKPSAPPAPVVSASAPAASAASRPAIPAPTAAQPHNTPVQRQKADLPEICTNAWISGEILSDMCVPDSTRGEKANNRSLICNIYARINGAESKADYLNKLFLAYSAIRDTKKNIISDSPLPMPTNEEISAVRRGNYNDIGCLVNGMSANIVHSSVQLQELMRAAFCEVMTDYFNACGDLRKVLNSAVYVLCWLKTYQHELFSGWKQPQTACFIKLGGCESRHEECFIKILGRLPCDVIIFMPDLSEVRSLSDPLLYERNYTESLTVKTFPREQASLSMGTVAYHAERELDEIMYSDSGIYRGYQFSKAQSIVLRTMYEEIKMLWPQELKFRPNFSAVNERVSIPVIAARVLGVKGSQKDYWKEIRSLVTENTITVCNAGILGGAVPPLKSDLFNGRELCREKIMGFRDYRYSFLKAEMQNYIFDKIQLLIDRSIINDRIEHIAAVGLSLSSDIVRMIQRFDFSKANPKLIYINTTEKTISLEDSIIIALLVQMGFDVLMFIPTGYMGAEKYYTADFLTVHELGEYQFDMTPPKFQRTGSEQGGFLKRLFN